MNVVGDEIVTKSRVKFLFKDLNSSINRLITKSNLVVGKNVVLNIEMDSDEYSLSIILNDYIYSISFLFNDGNLDKMKVDNVLVDKNDYNTIYFKMVEFIDMMDRKMSVLKIEGAKNIYEKYKVR